MTTHGGGQHQHRVQRFAAAWSPIDGTLVNEYQRTRFAVDDVLKRDKLNLDIFWLKDDSLEDLDILPLPDEIAADIVDNLQAALEALQSVADELATRSPT